MTAIHDTAEHARARDGLTVLSGAALAVRAELDRVFSSWGLDVGAEPVEYPKLLRTADLATLDYWVNFPHLALLAAGSDPDRAAELASVPESAFGGELLGTAEYALPSATCYAAYLDLRGRTLPATARITAVGTCFRRETHYDGLRRLLGFSMREVICVGDREDVLAHITSFKAKVTGFAHRLGLPLTVEAATDPFFDKDASRTLVAKLFPVKEEFVFRSTPDDPGLAIGSVNFHRNFFGERCAISLADGSAAFSGCAAFGLERWLAALRATFGPSWDAILERVRVAGSC